MTDANLGRASIAIRATLDQLDNDLGDARKKTEGTIGKIVSGATQKFQTMGKVVLGGAAVASGAVLGIGAAAVGAGSDFDDAMSTIAAGTGTTGQELERLGKDARSIFRQVPGDIQQAGEVVNELNTRLDLSGVALRRAGRQAMDFARVHDLEVGPSVAMTGKLVRALDMDAEDTSLVMDKLTKASQMSGIAVDALGQNILDAGPSFEELGFDLDRSIALFASFEAAGARPEEVISSLNLALNTIADEGFENAEEGFNEYMRRIEEAPDILEATRISSELFGRRVGSKVAEDIRAGRFDVEEWTEAIADAEGTLEATAKESLTFGDRVQIMRNRVGDALVPLGTAFLGLGETVLDVLMPAIEPLADVIHDRVAPFFEDVTVAVQTFIEAIQGGATPLEALESALQVAFGPEIADPILDIVDNIVAFIDTVWDVIEPIMEWISENVELQDVLIALGAAVASVVIPALASVVAAVGPVILVFAAVTAAVALVRKAWEEDWGGIRTWMTDFWNGTLKPLFKTLRDWLQKKVPKAVETLSDFWGNTLLPVLNDVWEFLDENVIPILEALAEVYIALVKKRLEFLVAIVRNLVIPALRYLWQRFRDVADFIHRHLGPAISWLSNNVFGPLAQTISDITGGVQGLLGWLRRLADRINSIQLPSWLQRGSLPPLAQSMYDISEGIQAINSVRMPDLFSKRMEGSVAFSGGMNAAIGGLGDPAGQQVNVREGAIDITINAADGMDERAIGDEVERRLYQFFKGLNE